MSEQLVVTHCRPQEAVFGAGETARAGSLPAGRLKTLYFNTIDRLLAQCNFSAPRDTPHAIRAKSTASTMPVRMVYLPTYRGHRILGQVCYRQTDSTRTRLGAYFAHFLLDELDSAAGAWASTECLKKWRSPHWLSANAASIGKRLSATAGLDAVPPGGIVNDDSLLAFLTEDTPAGGWRDDDLVAFCRFPPAVRRRHLEIALARLLELDLDADRHFLLVADPGVAAMLFYGSLRLAPRCLIRPAVSFSTYETALRRPLTHLTATTFFQPSRAALSEQELQRAAAVHNVFQPPPPQFESPAAHYASYAVATLVNEGWESATRLLGRIDEAQPAGLQELSLVIDVEKDVTRLFPPANADLSLAGLDAPDRSPHAWRTIRDRLVFGSQSADDLKALAACPNAIPICELFFQQARHRSIPACVESLARLLPLDVLERNLLNPALPVEYQEKMLIHCVQATGELPKALRDGIVNDAAAEVEPHVARLFFALGKNISADLLVALYKQAPPSTEAVMLAAILHACATRRAARTAFWRLLDSEEPLSREVVFKKHNRDVAARIVEDNLVKRAVPPDILRAVASSPNAPLTLALLRGGGRIEPLFFDIAAQLTPDTLLAALRCPQLPPPRRAVILRQHLQSEGLSASVRAALAKVGNWRTDPQSRQLEMVLDELVRTAQSDAIVRLYGAYPTRQRHRFLQTMLKQRESCRQGADVCSRINEAIQTIVAKWHSDRVRREAVRLGSGLLEACTDRTVRDAVHAALRTLTDATQLHNLGKEYDFLRVVPSEKLGLEEFTVERWLSFIDGVKQLAAAPDGWWHEIARQLVERYKNAIIESDLSPRDRQCLLGRIAAKLNCSFECRTVLCRMFALDHVAKQACSVSVDTRKRQDAFKRLRVYFPFPTGIDGGQGTWVRVMVRIAFTRHGSIEKETEIELDRRWSSEVPFDTLGVQHWDYESKTGRRIAGLEITVFLKADGWPRKIEFPKKALSLSDLPSTSMWNVFLVDSRKRNGSDPLFLDGVLASGACDGDAAIEE